MEIKCIGCGSTLQFVDENKIGYIDKSLLEKKDLENLYCKRCFKLKNYNIYSPVTDIDFNKINNEVKINKNAILVMIIDVFMIDSTFIDNLYSIYGKKDLIIILSRYDCFKDLVNKNKIISYINLKAKKCKYNLVDIIFSNNEDRFINHLQNENKDFYFVGYTNTGKSTFINKVLKKIYQIDKDYIVTSKNIGTTLDLIKIPYKNNYFLIDTPGLNLNSYYNINHIIKNKVNTINYQVIKNQSYIVEDLFSINIYNQTTISFLFSNTLKIHRTKYENRLKYVIDNHKKNINLNDNLFYDIEISGFGFFRIKGKISFDITSKINLDIYVRKSII